MNRISLIFLVLLAGLVGCETGPKTPKLKVAHNWGGAEREAFEEMLRAFDESQPELELEIRALSSGEYHPWILNQFVAGMAPDVFLTASPGLMKELAKSGRIAVLNNQWRDFQEEGRFNNSWEPLISVDGSRYGIPFKSSAKGLVWYSPKELARLGLQIPKDWDSWMSFLQTAKATSVPVFSVGGRDGWPLSDWFEQVLLRTQGGEVSVGLAEEKISWTDPKVVAAFNRLKTVMEIAFPEDPLAQGFVEAVHARASGKALLQLQGGWVNLMTKEYNQKLMAGEDYDFFSMPGREGVVIGGDFILVSNSSEQKSKAFELVDFLSSAKAQELWVKKGGYIATNKSVSSDLYPDVLAKKEAELIGAAKSLYFDLDDQLTARMQRIFWEKLQEFVMKPDPERISKELSVEATAKN